MQAEQTETELIIRVPASQENDLYTQIFDLVQIFDETTIQNKWLVFWELYELLGEQQTRRAKEWQC